VTQEAILSFEYPTAERALRIERSLRPEIGDIEGDRTAARLDRDGAGIALSITADDLVALRAGINTWSTLVGVAEGVGQE